MADEGTTLPVITHWLVFYWDKEIDIRPAMLDVEKNGRVYVFITSDGKYRGRINVNDAAITGGSVDVFTTQEQAVAAAAAYKLRGGKS